MACKSGSHRFLAGNRTKRGRKRLGNAARRDSATVNGRKEPAQGRVETGSKACDIAANHQHTAFPITSRFTATQRAGRVAETGRTQISVID